MDNLLVVALKNKVEALGNIDSEIKRNYIKEELQYYILNFICHHSEYSKWTMYGGSALRICHNLNRMSVDLDFEIANESTVAFLEKLKEDIEKYFLKTYAVDTNLLKVAISGTRGLVLRFQIGDELSLDIHSKQINVKIDLNHFVAEKTVVERIPINRDQFSFVIKTYNLSGLMASKIAAVFLRGTRIVGKKTYGEKGRDIYDLLWYMEKKVVPDLDYLIAKNIEANNYRQLFDALTIRMNSVSDENLKQDLTPLFLEPTYIQNWLSHWLNTYLHLFEEYKIHNIAELTKIHVHTDFSTDNVTITFEYTTEEKKRVVIRYSLSDYWMEDIDDIGTPINEIVVGLLQENQMTPISDLIKKYISLFFIKNQNYLKKTSNTILGNEVETKLIRTTAQNLKRNEQIVLTKSALLSAELEDLLK